MSLQRRAQVGLGPLKDSLFVDDAPETPAPLVQSRAEIARAVAHCSLQPEADQAEGKEDPLWPMPGWLRCGWLLRGLAVVDAPAVPLPAPPNMTVGPKRS